MKRLFALGVALAASLTATPADATPGPAHSPEFWFNTWHVASLWRHGARGQGVTIAEIDTGVNAKLPALHGRVLVGHDFGAKGNGQIDRDQDPFGHGTAMASIMVGRPGLLGITGVAPAAKILPLAVPLRQTTTAAQPDSVPQAIRYAANHDADIINLSLGGLRPPTPNTQPCRVAEQAAIYYALRKGALVVASVGNTGRTKNAVEDPAVCLGVVAVGAVDSNGKVAGFSAREPYLTLVAPGVNIPSLGRLPGQAFTGAGTSQATALTSAVAALVWSAHPDLGAYGVAARIIATLDKHRSRPSRSYGYGVLDAYRAVTAGVPADSPNPVFDAAAPFLSRADTLNHPPAKPAPAAHGSGGVLGDYHPGAAVQWLTGQVKLAMVLAGCGLALLVVLAAVGLRRRRQRRRLDQHQPVPVASGQLEPEWRVIAAQSRPHRPLDEEPAPPRPEPR